MTYTPTCPYITEVEIKAWGEGLTAGLHTDNERDTNPYTSGDTTVAWATGWDDAKYQPAPFNPADIADMSPTVQRYIGTTVWHDRASRYDEHIKGTYLLYTWVGGTLDGKPDWADNRQEHRAVPIDRYTLGTLVRRSINDQAIVSLASIDLPCPPYTFEYSEGGMEISAGAFKKWGDKTDWEGVIQLMTEKLEAMPPGLDVEDVSITLDVQQAATAMWTVQVPLTDLLSGSLEGSIFSGTEDELHDEVVNALEDIDSDVTQSYYADINYELDDYGDVEVEPSDLTYDLQDVREA